MRSTPERRGGEGERNAKARESKRSVQRSACSLHLVPPFLPPIHARISLITFQRNSSSWLSDQTKLLGIVDRPKREKEIRRKGGGDQAVDGTGAWCIQSFVASEVHLLHSLLLVFETVKLSVAASWQGHACVNKALCSYRLGIKPAVGHWRCSTFEKRCLTRSTSLTRDGSAEKKVPNGDVCAGLVGKSGALKQMRQPGEQGN